MNQKTNQQLTQFFIISFIISWLLWLPGVLQSNGFSDWPDIVRLPGMFAPFGPMIAAFWLTYRENGRFGLKELWMRARRQQFDKKWLLPALLIGPVTALAAVGLILLTGGSVEWQYGLPWTAWGPVFALLYLTNALPEEFGWRGFALDRLQAGRSALTASLILGVIWGVWHLPLHFTTGTTQEVIPVYEFVLQQMVLSVIYTWLFNNTNGSVLIATLYHTMSNISAAAVPFWTTTSGRWLSFIVLVAVAGIVVWRWGWQHLSQARRNAEPLPVSEER